MCRVEARRRSPEGVRRRRSAGEIPHLGGLSVSVWFVGYRMLCGVSAWATFGAGSGVTTAVGLLRWGQLKSDRVMPARLVLRSVILDCLTGLVAISFAAGCTGSSNRTLSSLTSAEVVGSWCGSTGEILLMGDDGRFTLERASTRFIDLVWDRFTRPRDVPTGVPTAGPADGPGNMEDRRTWNLPSRASFRHVLRAACR